MVELYKLHLDLPFAVLDEESKAKFDKKSGTLSIEVPVVPAPIVEMVIYGWSYYIYRDDLLDLPLLAVI